MKLLCSITAVTSLLTSFVSGAAQFTGSGYQIRDFKVRILRPARHSHKMSNIKFDFGLLDTDPLTHNASAKCTATWSPEVDAGPSSDHRAPCSNGTFFWYLRSSDFTGPKMRLELEAQHSYVDPSVGEAPMNVVTTFAKTSFSAPENMTCFLCNRHQYDCSLKPNTSRVMQVYAAIA